MAKEFARRFDLCRCAGILTCCPSTTPFGLVLGPGSPWADLPSPGNLGHSANGILTRLIVTQAGIFTSYRSTDPSGTASRLIGTLSYRFLRSPQLRPTAYSRSLSAPESSTSEL